jgi:hypothetical protein
MGQYYKVILLNAQGIQFFIEITFGYGMKLTEHSSLESNFVNSIEELFTPDGPFYKYSLVWAGDYGDYEQDQEENLYSLAKSDLKHYKLLKNHIPKPNQYLVNHTLKTYVDKKKCASFHPLPLLVAEGNGKGGGDYFEKNKEYVGLWARHLISSESSVANDFKEFIPNFS